MARVVDGPPGCDVDDRGHDQVDRDHVDHALWHAGERFEQPSGVAEDDRLGHTEALDPAGPRFGPGRFDDGRAHDGDRDLAPGFIEGPLAECFGVWIDVWPSEGDGPGSAGLDQLLVNPTLPDLFGFGREQWGACRSQLVASLFAESLQSFGGPGVGIEIGPRSSGRFDLGPPVDVDVEWAVAQQLLGSAAPAIACHVAGGDGDEVRGHTKVVEGVGDSGWAEQVDLHRTIEWCVEADRCRGVDDDVAVGEGSPTGFVEAESVLADVACHHLDPVFDLSPERILASVGQKPIEGVVPEDLTPGPLRRV